MNNAMDSVIMPTVKSSLNTTSPKQSVRMHRYFIATGMSILTIGLFYLCYLQSILAITVFYHCAALILLTSSTFYTLFRSGLNLRFSDSSLTMPQMLVATGITLYAMYEASGGQAVFLLILTMTFLFGLLRLKIRSLILCALSILAAYATIIASQWLNNPQVVDIHLEILQWLALALTLTWFTLMGGLTGTLRDRLSESNRDLREMLQRVQASENNLAQAQRIAGIGSWTFDPVGCASSWSVQTYHLFGIDPTRPPYVGKSFLKLVHPDDRHIFRKFIRVALGDGFEFSEQLRIMLENGETRWLQVMGQPINVEGQARILSGTVMDITERKAAEDEIRQLAFYDSLTRLPNRRLLVDRLTQALFSAKRSKQHGALLFIDLDNFKTINDIYGHDKGDELLQMVAERLSSCVRKCDTVARLGGDEFVVMLTDLSEVMEEAVLQTRTIGTNILKVLNRSYELTDDIVHKNSVSIGVTLFDGHMDTNSDLLKRADLAMYQSKAAGKNTLRFFEANMQVIVNHRAAMEVALRQGIDEGQFILYYQAQMNDTGSVTGAEALVRWQHPELGLVSPIKFIAQAEENGLILPLGHWILENACEQLAQWALSPDMANLTIAVNVSAKQFRQPDFVQQIIALIERTGANPRKLKLELTESMLVDNIEEVIVKMNILKSMGVNISLDDFGIGYSSLSYLKHLPLDQIKIDQSFVRDVVIDSNDVAIICTIVVLARSLGLSVIAEGVETEAQKDMLFRNGCNAYQGYLFSRPLPLEAFGDMVSANLQNLILSESQHTDAHIVQMA